jgi:enolase
MIDQFTTRPILNSRGEWTIEVTLRSGELTAIASVPQGESRGAYEAVSVSADQAVKNILEIIAPVMVGQKLGDQNSLDNKLKESDGTATKERLGGNALLVVSMVYARLSARAENLPLWQYLRHLSTTPSVKDAQHSVSPRLLSLMIEGGLHAPGASPFQEYLVLPRTTTIIESVNIVTKLYSALRQLISDRFGPGATHLGDEGAFAPLIADPLAPMSLIMEAARVAGLDDKFDLGLDAAADNVFLSPEELNTFYDQARANYPLCYLEDPFKENELDNFASLLAKSNKELMIAGDDLTVTNVERIKLAQAKGSINAMIIKPNQIGTVTETLEAVKLAREYGWKVIVSHRGQETNDDFIADLAWGIGADGIKLGAPARGERVAKYNRLLEIEATQV